MSETPDRRDPDFDLRTAKPDPRWLVSDVITPGDFDAVAADTAMRLMDKLKAQYPDETMDIFALAVEQTDGYRVVVGFGFSHNPLDGDA